jgi:hypothetical protein
MAAKREVVDTSIGAEDRVLVILHLEIRGSLIRLNGLRRKKRFKSSPKILVQRMKSIYWKNSRAVIAQLVERILGECFPKRALS